MIRYNYSYDFYNCLPFNSHLSFIFRTMLMLWLLLGMIGLITGGL